MRIVFMSTPGFGLPALRALAARHEIAAVYTQPDRPAGRGQQPRPCPVALEARARGLPLCQPSSLRDPAEQAAFAALGADVAVVVAYGLILPRAILAAPARGCLNIHASLLPRWRGAAPIQRAIEAGDAQTGVCIMRMEEGLDTGPVLLSEATPIGPADTAGDLHDRLAEMGAALILRALGGLETLVPRPQPAEGVTYAAKIDKAEARIAWDAPAEAVCRRIHALSPHPGAWTLAAGERLRILRARPCAGAGEPGRALGGLRVACGQGAIEILEAQREGRRAMGAEELARGFALPDILI